MPVFYLYVCHHAPSVLLCLSRLNAVVPTDSSTVGEKKKRHWVNRPCNNSEDMLFTNSPHKACIDSIKPHLSAETLSLKFCLRSFKRNLKGIKGSFWSVWSVITWSVITFWYVHPPCWYQTYLLLVLVGEARKAWMSVGWPLGREGSIWGSSSGISKIWHNSL